MAGARGDATARIFTTHLDAELLAVAGVYRVVEDKLDRSLHNQPALIRLDGDTLRIEAPEGLTQHPISARAQINYTHSVRSLTRAFALR